VRVSVGERVRMCVCVRMEESERVLVCEEMKELERVQPRGRGEENTYIKQKHKEKT